MRPYEHIFLTLYSLFLIPLIQSDIFSTQAELRLLQKAQVRCPTSGRMPWNSSRLPTWISHHPLLRIRLPQSPSSLALPYHVGTAHAPGYLHIPSHECDAWDVEGTSQSCGDKLRPQRASLPQSGLEPSANIQPLCGPNPPPF